jgi:Ca2+-binding EF-hand superfamily protein
MFNRAAFSTVACLVLALFSTGRLRGDEPSSQEPDRLVVRLKQIEAGGEKAVVVIKDRNDAPGEPRRVIVLQNTGAGGAVVVGQRGAQPGYDVPDEVDPRDNVERLLLLLPGGPIVIDVAMTIDGWPYQVPLEAIVDEWQKVIDPEGTGKTTWADALANPRFADGRMAYTAQNEQVRERLVKQYDTNGDSLIDRGELRRLVAQSTGGASFALLNYNYSQNLSGPLQELLDRDGDGELSPEELAEVGARLKSRDANDNDVLDQNELLASGGAYGVQRRGAVVRGEQILYHLTSATDFAALHQVLAARYGKDGALATESLTLVPGLGARLDISRDSSIDKDELAGLLSMFAHVQLELNLGESGTLPAGLRVASVSEDLRSRLRCPVEVTDDNQFVLDFSEVRVLVIASNATPRYANYDQSVAAMMNQYDKDKNGYLEKSELQQGLSQQFDAWDANTDGKVFADEIKASYEKLQANTWKRISAGAADQGNALYAAIDANGDGRIGLREMHTASERLAALDADGSGRLSTAEIPSNVRVALARGPYAYLGLNAYRATAYASGGGVVGARGGNQAEQPEGPDWFFRMDRNVDGDISPREFLGDAELFAKIDTNGDGFIELAEAKAADQGE